MDPEASALLYLHFHTCAAVLSICSSVRIIHRICSDLNASRAFLNVNFFLVEKNILSSLYIILSVTLNLLSHFLPSFTQKHLPSALFVFCYLNWCFTFLVRAALQVFYARRWMTLRARTVKLWPMALFLTAAKYPVCFGLTLTSLPGTAGNVSCLEELPTTSAAQRTICEAVCGSVVALTTLLFVYLGLYIRNSASVKVLPKRSVTTRNDHRDSIYSTATLAQLHTERGTSVGTDTTIASIHSTSRWPLSVPYTVAEHPSGEHQLLLKRTLNHQPYNFCTT